MPSSVIRGWIYQAFERRLDVTFVSGRRYSYHEVPQQIADGLRGASSKGSYFNEHIRDHFHFTEVGRGVSGTEQV